MRPAPPPYKVQYSPHGTCACTHIPYSTSMKRCCTRTCMIESKSYHSTRRLRFGRCPMRLLVPRAPVTGHTEEEFCTLACSLGGARRARARALQRAKVEADATRYTEAFIFATHCKLACALAQHALVCPAFIVVPQVLLHLPVSVGVGVRVPRSNSRVLTSLRTRRSDRP